jgi:imidazolonepropionase-like amidohydrolase
MRREGEIGALVPGAFADLLIVEGDPAASLGMLADPGQGLRLVMQGGRTVLDRLAEPAGPAAPEPAHR